MLGVSRIYSLQIINPNSLVGKGVWAVGSKCSLYGLSTDFGIDSYPIPASKIPGYLKFPSLAKTVKIHLLLYTPSVGTWVSLPSFKSFLSSKTFSASLFLSGFLFVCFSEVLESNRENSRGSIYYISCLLCLIREIKVKPFLEQHLINNILVT